MKKIPIYFVPGLAAGPEIFEHLELDPEKYSFHYLKWIRPLALEEDIDNYACRMSDEVKEKNPVLVGVSFGGIMVQEMAKFVNPRKVIIISSVKNQEELPKKFKLAKFTKVYKFFPTKVISNFEEYAQYFLGKSLKKKAEIYKKYLSVRGEKYLKWSIYNVLKWKQINPVKNIVHIHGTKDNVFPLKHIKDAIEIKGGTHIMILTKAKKISKIIDEVLTC
ncbi:alpha/beta hydrolase [Polaribacter aestuariivivens]|uniref:Alpha/beta hydrolase n=1 Tax=Polaribacter aestuariivivens TaxID=2304626 RepID=A0A5S3NA46_9FLAO|nr:alpha/beta hydrolase [Polaribacter aestuariivivens]TMM31404.1 alpha/beta hydrolase [Polaribacter aestuariivivens]